MLTTSILIIQPILHILISNVDTNIIDFFTELIIIGYTIAQAIETKLLNKDISDQKNLGKKSIHISNYYKIIDRRKNQNI
ncbi:hypothetical protein GSH19_00065 [Lactobacillus sp. S2-2]|uniref:hypothetical protein n=1 Tax=Lactobacillus sp. S2-2 TaxID=2692917 RepID=UPI001F36A6C2|nr:hypothetical protein [Lactobacillus sp. S2-2]MCF6514580.1 hypothetical protein [Lactobacillus sp. S2-2]